jgi:hypothetical protein
MKKLIAAAMFLACPLAAQDFSEESDAKTWNLYAEQPARFEAKVVDLLCVLAGDCPDNCGDGRRQLGLLRAVDDVLVFPNKNSQPVFTGANIELLPFCGKEVEVDGLLVEDPDLGSKNVYLLQKIRESGASDWTTADRWTKEWAKANPEAQGKSPWFRRDPRVKDHIKKEGYFGLGLDVDQTYFEENF